MALTSRDRIHFAGLGPRWLRVGVRTATENAQVAAAIAEQREVILSQRGRRRHLSS